MKNDVKRYSIEGVHRWVEDKNGGAVTYAMHESVVDKLEKQNYEFAVQLSNCVAYVQASLRGTISKDEALTNIHKELMKGIEPPQSEDKK